jgi:hypothetical protein
MLQDPQKKYKGQKINKKKKNNNKKIKKNLLGMVLNRFCAEKKYFDMTYFPQMLQDPQKKYKCQNIFFCAESVLEHSRQIIFFGGIFFPDTCIFSAGLATFVENVSTS